MVWQAKLLLPEVLKLHKQAKSHLHAVQKRLLFIRSAQLRRQAKNCLIFRSGKLIHNPVQFPILTPNHRIVHRILLRIIKIQHIHK